MTDKPLVRDCKNWWVPIPTMRMKRRELLELFLLAASYVVVRDYVESDRKRVLQHWVNWSAVNNKEEILRRLTKWRQQRIDDSIGYVEPSKPRMHRGQIAVVSATEAGALARARVEGIVEKTLIPEIFDDVERITDPDTGLEAIPIYRSAGHSTSQPAHPRKGKFRGITAAEANENIRGFPEPDLEYFRIGGK